MPSSNPARFAATLILSFVLGCSSSNEGGTGAPAPNDALPPLSAVPDADVGRIVDSLGREVLLRGVNDQRDTLTELLRGLSRIRVRPLYIHQCDPVAGIEHFRTPLSLGPSLLEPLRPTLGGTSLPRLMVDLPHGGGKVPWDGGRHLTDLQGRPVEYPKDPQLT